MVEKVTGYGCFSSNMDLLHQFLYIKASTKLGLHEPVTTVNYEYALPHNTPNIQHITKL
jgi:hypothetical protein